MGYFCGLFTGSWLGYVNVLGMDPTAFGVNGIKTVFYIYVQVFQTEVLRFSQHVESEGAFSCGFAAEYSTRYPRGRPPRTRVRSRLMDSVGLHILTD